MGWQVKASSEALSWEVYEPLAVEEHGAGELSRVRYLRDHVRTNDLIWTRDTSGKYYLAKVIGPPGAPVAGSAWEYMNTEAGRDADIVNVVRCRILPVPQGDDIPGKIVACFRPSRVIQSITDETAVLYSFLLWNQLSGSEDYELTRLADYDIFSFLDAESTEDVIFIFLQCHGWIVVPNSRKVDTMGYEFLAINRETEQRAVVQVKTGNTPLETDKWATFSELVYLFQSRGKYFGSQPGNVITLAPEEVLEFMDTHFAIMPRAVQRWLNFVRDHRLASGPTDGASPVGRKSS